MGSNGNNSKTMRIRVKFAKTEPMRFTSHLDLYRAWERLLRRADVPLVFSQGFNPRPRIQLAAPLPLGITSSCEIIDIWMSDNQLDLQTLRTRIIQVQPPGIEVHGVEYIDPKFPPLQKKVHAAEFSVALLDPTSNLDRKIATLLNSESILRQRRGKSYDLRPLINDLSLVPGQDIAPIQLFMQLSAQESGTGRPEEVLLALEIPPENTRIERIRLLYNP